MGVGRGGGFAIAGAENALGEVLREAVGPYVDQLGGEVGIDGGGFGVEVEGDGAGDFSVRSRGGVE